jgi:hypothetical protein
MKPTGQSNVTRRQILQLLTAIGISGPAALELAAQAGNQITPEMLKSANALLDQGFDDERLRVISAALGRNLDQFRDFRELEIDDMVEPAPIFLSKGR